ncbi:hypothetical protein F4861DRAFT_533221 [Xylaria intraflava]|nr:hypothetical protein F4861DRAFT_533221 [Xylaria intraflava]
MAEACIRKHLRKKAATKKRLYSKYLLPPSSTKRQPSLPGNPSRLHGGSISHNQHGHSRQSHESGIELDAESNGSIPELDDRGLDRDPFNTRKSPFTPQRPFRLTSSAHWSSESAPALLENNMTPDLNSTPSRRRRMGNGLSAQEIDDKIVEILKKPLTKKQLDTDKTGNNYLFEVVPTGDPGKTIVKIGHTTGTEQRRLKQIGAQCGHFSIKQEEDPEGSPILLYHKAELLMQAELENFLYRFSCTCRRAHREYFDLDKATAQEVIQRWRAFCESDPYDADGNLRPFWAHRLRRRKQLCGDMQDSLQDLSGEERRRARWRRFSSPTKFEKIYFDVSYTSARLWMRRWHAVAFAQALVIAVITFPSAISFAWFTLISLCVFAGTSGLHFPVSLASF